MDKQGDATSEQQADMTLSLSITIADDQVCLSGNDYADLSAPTISIVMSET